MTLFTKNEWKVAFKLMRAMGDMALPGHNPSCGYYVERNAAIRPDRPAVFFEDRKLTYAELNSMANRVANFFKSIGAKKGETVALVMENCPEFLAILAGCSKIGVVVSLINTNLRHKVLVHALTICSPTWIIVGTTLLDELMEVHGDLPVKRDHVFIWDGPAPAGREKTDFGKLIAEQSDANITPRHNPQLAEHTINIYTSGTTGLPKAAKVSNRRWFFSGWALGFSLADMTEEDVVYSPLPLYHSIAIYVAWGSSLVTGGAIGIRRKFSASDYWKEAKRFGATMATFIGEMPRYLINQPPAPQDKDHAIRRVITVGLRANIWEEFEKRFGIATIYEFYGATETNVGIMNADGRPGYLGRLIPLQAKVVRWDSDNDDFLRNEKGRCIECQPGEAGVLLGSKMSALGFDGYLDAAETDQKIVRGVKFGWDEYFNTGDMVKLHEDRWVSFVDRLGDTFRWKGENVSTKEVELVLDNYPGVSEVNVYGVQVPGQEGRAGMAALVLMDNFDIEHFSKYITDNLPHYARPLFVRSMKDMQTTVTLKHVKYNLRKEGFDPSKLGDKIFFWNRHQEKYVPLETDLHADLVSGNFKL